MAQSLVAPYSLKGRPAGITEKVTHVQAVSADLVVLTRIRREQPSIVRFSLPLPDQQTAVITMVRAASIAPGQQIRQTGGKPVRTDRGLHYQTPVKSDFGALSLTELSHGEFHLSGLFAYRGKTYVLAPDSSGRLLIFPEAEMPGQNPFICATEEGSQPERLRPTQGGPPPTAPTACATTVKVMVEADYQAYLDNGFSVPRTVAWINSVWNVVGRFYAAVDIPLEVTDTYIHTVPDAWPAGATSVGAVIVAFNDTLRRRGYTGNIQHLMSTRPAQQGGVAGTAPICQAGPHAGYSNIYFTYEQLPAYSWTINCIAHEVGHNMGSNHTHWCGWELRPGVFGAIDSCYYSQSATGGPCFTNLKPRVGTVMSYCHIYASVDLTRGFGPLPEIVVRDRFAQSSCLTPGTSLLDVSVTSMDTACEGEPLHLAVTAPSGSSYLWTGPGGFSSAASSLDFPSFSTSQAGEYTVSVTSGACTTRPYPILVLADCIPSESTSGTRFCSEDAAALSFRSGFTPQAGNTYTVELSDSAGVFAPSPRVVGSLASTAQQGQIPITLPEALPSGSQYRFRVRASHPAKLGRESRSVTVQPGSTAPITTGANSSTPGMLTLQGIPPTGMATFWYEDSLSAQPLAEGTSFTTPSLSASHRYWAQSKVTGNKRVGIASHFGMPDSNPLGIAGYGMYFTVLNPMVLDSLRIFTSRYGTTYFIITNVQTGAPAYSGSHYVRPVPTSGSKIRLNVRLEPGSYLIQTLATTDMPWLYVGRSPTPLPYPYRLDNLMTIDSAKYTRGQGLKNWCFFYDWRVRPASCPSERVPVWARIGSCSPPAAPLAPDTAVCTGTTITLSASGAPSGFGYRWYADAAGSTTLPNGQTAQLAYTATRTDTLYVGLQDLSDPGCRSVLTGVIVQALPVPPPPALTLQNDTLFSSHAGTILWIRDGILLPLVGTRVPHPVPGVWQAIAVLPPCLSDTSNPIRVSTPTRVRELAQRPTIYPNPTDGLLHIGESSGYTRYQVLDLLGQTVQDGPVSGSIQLGELPPGLYMFCLSSPGKSPYRLRIEKK